MSGVSGPAGVQRGEGGGGHLVVSVDGGVVEGRVVVVALHVDVGAGAQQLVRDVHPAVVTRLVQRRPAWGEEDDGGQRRGGQADRRTGGQADRRTGGQADRRTGGQADRSQDTGHASCSGVQPAGRTMTAVRGGADRRTGGQADRRTGGQADRRTGGPADRQTGHRTLDTPRAAASSLRGGR